MMTTKDREIRRIVEENQQRVRRFLLSLGVPARETDDLAQEVFVRACGSAGGFRGESSVETWLYSIARHVAASHRRKSARERSRQGALDEAPAAFEIPDGRTGQEAALEREETARLVRDALDALPPIHKDVLLGEAEGRTYREMASDLDVPVGTVRSRLHNARRSAAAILALALAAACGRAAFVGAQRLLRLNRTGKWQEAARAATAASSASSATVEDRCGALANLAWADARLGRDPAAVEAMSRFQVECAELPRDSWMRGEIAKLDEEYTVGSPSWHLKRAMRLNQVGDWPSALLAADAAAGATTATVRQRCEALFDKSYALTRLGRRTEAVAALELFDRGCGMVPKGDWTRRETGKLKAELIKKPTP